MFIIISVRIFSGGRPTTVLTRWEASHRQRGTRPARRSPPPLTRRRNRASSGPPRWRRGARDRRCRPLAPGRSTKASPGGNAGHQESAHVTAAVLRSLDWVRLCEVLDREMRLERQQLCDIGLGFVGASKMAQGGDEGLVARAELRLPFHGAAPQKRRLLVIAVEKVGDHVDAFKNARIGVVRRQVAVALQPLQGGGRFADITIGRGAEPPYERQVGIEAQRTIIITDGGVEVLFPQA